MIVAFQILVRIEILVISLNSYFLFQYELKDFLHTPFTASGMITYHSASFFALLLRMW